MTGYNSRGYSGSDDLEEMIILLPRCREKNRIADFPSEADYLEMLSMPSIKNNTRIWSDANRRLIAFALVDSYNNLLFEVENTISDPALFDEIISWGEECLSRSRQNDKEELSLDASCWEDDLKRIKILEQHGFVSQLIRSLHLERSLNEPIPVPEILSGFTIRPSKGLDEAEEWVCLHRSAWGTESMTIEERTAILSGPDYIPQLDLVATAPDGTLAAYCLCQIHRNENLSTGRNEGWTDPITTHPDFQRRGLAHALLLTGMQLLKDRGIDTAVMGTSSENEKMLRTALALGFQIVSEKIWFSKSV